MKIGIKFELAYEAYSAYRDLYGDRDVLPYMREIGIQAIEVPIGAEIDGASLIDLVKQCRDEDLGVSYHPYTERSPNNPAHFSLARANPCRQLHERFLQYADAAADILQDAVNVNIHPAAEVRDVSRRRLVDQSIRFFDWASQWCKDHAPHVKPLAELQIRANPDEDIQRIGDAYDELLGIAEDGAVATTWDFGHAFMNSRRFGDDINPPEPFLRRVAHVHCHDVSDTDHQPLIHHNVPWQWFLDSLLRAGFDGTVVLEVRPEEFLAAGGLDALTHSVSALHQHLRL